MAKGARSGIAPLHVEVVTAAGTVQADAAQIPIKSSPALIVAAGDNTVGIKLPPASKGQLFFVKNTGAGSLKVWPSSGDAVNAGGTDNAYSMATVTSALFAAKDSSTWYTFPLVAS